MTVTTEQLSAMVGGEVVGSHQSVWAVVPVADNKKGTISPLFKMKYLKGMGLPIPGVLLVSRHLLHKAMGCAESFICCDDPMSAFIRVIEVLMPQTEDVPRVHCDAFVHPGARLGRDVSVAPGAVVSGDVIVGDGTVIGANAVIEARTRLGAAVRIGPGAIIGHAGFGFVRKNGRILRIPQVGGVCIGDRVDIGAGTCVDRGTIGDTVIGNDTCIDNLVQIGHNCRIGQRVVIAAQTGVAGSTVIADDVVFGGQVGVADHLHIGAGAMVGAKSGVTRDVNPDERVSGYPAMGRFEWLRGVARLKRDDKTI